MGGSNPRYRNGARRRALRERVKAQGLPCAICGREIDYSLPARHPMSFELDEIVPVSRYREGGYASKQQCALDPQNVRPTHRICNQRRGNGRRRPPEAAGDAIAPGIENHPGEAETARGGRQRALENGLPRSREW